MNSLLTRFIGLFWRIFSRYLSISWFEWKGVDSSRARGAVMYGFPIIQKSIGGSILIGERIVLCSRSEFTALGVSRPIIIRAMTSSSKIIIGDDVGLSGTTICANDSITIGDGCLVGADVVICDNDFHPLEALDRRYSLHGVKAAPVSIGKNVFIGARSIVLKGVTIGDNSVIGAGSVVVSSIPSNVIAAGNPCRVVRVL